MKKQIEIIPKVLQYFLENSYKEIYLRELARKLKISPYSVKKYCDVLSNGDLIVEERKANLRYFKANMGSLFFKFLKITNNIKNIENCGIIAFLKENLAGVSSITLFGSMARGENDEKSDMDLLIIGKKKKSGYPDLNDFKNKLSMEITMHLFSWDEWNEQAKENKAFYSDIIKYGIPLYGELPLIK
jgi:predicted nucleotidyltransferase